MPRSLEDRLDEEEYWNEVEWLLEERFEDLMVAAEFGS